MTRTTRLVIVAFVAGLALSRLGCGEGTGVCTACCGSGGRTYCKDGWTRAECDDWSQQMVNGLTWTFYAGQTCADRGTPATP